MIEQFPFRVRGFHSDNGSEFLNRTVEKLLNKLLIEQTKSRPRHSNDNGLGGIEKRRGDPQTRYTHIAAPHARIQRFYQQHFNPYLNFHRLRTTRNREQRQRQAEAGVPPLPDALGIFREVARGRQLSQARHA